MQSQLDASRTLIVKGDGAGGVLRTTPLLHLLSGEIDWLTAPHNVGLLSNDKVRVLGDIAMLGDKPHYDLIISLEEDMRVLVQISDLVISQRTIGTYLSPDQREILYTPSSSGWFDLTLVSRLGLSAARAKKMRNRLAYQNHLFTFLGKQFNGEPYIMPTYIPSPILTGDIAFVSSAGPTWPNKVWPWFSDCADHFSRHYRVNILPYRDNVLQHIADITGHRFVVANDTLGMHVAMGFKKQCIGIFTCTSPWEIFDYDLLTKVVSPRLAEFFYDTGYNEEAGKAVRIDVVIDAIERALDASDTETSAARP